jgi:hypothetical protein
VEPTFGRVSSFVTGVLQTQSPGGTDIFYINAPTGSGTTTSVTAGALLSHSGGGFLNQNQNRITFTNVSNVVATLADFTGDNDLDVAFALTPTVAGTTNLCVYYGTGADYNPGRQRGQFLRRGGWPPTPTRRRAARTAA